MRTPHNDPALVSAHASAMMPTKGASKEPERRCIISGEHGSRAALIRLALGPDGQVLPDVRARAPGRGAWIGVDRTGLVASIAKGKLKAALARAFKSAVEVPLDLDARIEAALAQDALNRLGLEARASTLFTGSEKIQDAARKGRVHLLIHAADASEDGRRRLDQAWRIGLDEEGSGRTGLVLGANRATVSAALGRENAVHLAIVDQRAARRVATAIDRWHGFIGLPLSGWPCETVSQGSGQRLADADGMKDFKG
jgi:uncharacterized protein